MKHLILLSLSAVLSASVSAQNYFSIEGTQWNVAYHSCDPTDASELAVQFSLEGSTSISGHDCLQYWRTELQNPDTRHLVGYVYTEGDKVYFLHPSCLDESPLLIYDFSLYSNDLITTHVAMEEIHSDYYPTSLQRCAGISQVTSNGHTYDCLEMCELLPDGTEPNYAHHHGQWIKGIGGLSFNCGIFGNNGYDLDGPWAELYSVVVDGDTVYNSRGMVADLPLPNNPASPAIFQLTGVAQQYPTGGLQIINGRIVLIR